MDKEVRKEKIAELRKYHEAYLNTLPSAYFACKHAHYPDQGEEKVIGLFESEVSKGDDIFIEFTNMDYVPADSSRRLYVWKHNPEYKSIYKFNDKTKQYLVPTSELHVVTANTVTWTPEMKLAEKGMLPLDMTPPAAPVFEKTSSEETIRRIEKYKGADGVQHKVVFVNNIPVEYHRHCDNEHHPFMLELALHDTIQFFKQLKY